MLLYICKINKPLKKREVIKMNMKKLIEINDYLREHAYDLTMVEFLSLIDNNRRVLC